MTLLLFRYVVFALLFMIQKIFKKLKEYEYWNMIYDYFRAVSLIIIFNF